MNLNHLMNTMNEQEKDTRMRKPGRPHKKEELYKVLIVVEFPEGRVVTKKLTSIFGLKTMEWDGYLVLSIKFYCELTSFEETKHIIEFLDYHGRCFPRLK